MKPDSLFATLLFSQESSTVTLELVLHAVDTPKDGEDSSRSIEASVRVLIFYFLRGLGLKLVFRESITLSTSPQRSFCWVTLNR